MTDQHELVTPGYLQEAARLVRPVKQRSYDLMQIQQRDSVLDVGCGPGIDTIPLAYLVGPMGQVIGVDTDPEMIAEADQLVEQAGLGARVTHRLCDATAMPFDSGSFDSCRSERVFQHLQDPEKVLSEMKRVTRTQGWVVVVDTDWGSLSIDSRDTDTERQFGRVCAEKCVPNGYSGRRLHGMFRQYGFSDICLEVIPFYFTSYNAANRYIRIDRVINLAIKKGYMPTKDLTSWHRDLEASEKDGSFFASVNTVVIGGQKL